MKARKSGAILSGHFSLLVSPRSIRRMRLSAQRLKATLVQCSVACSVSTRDSGMAVLASPRNMRRQAARRGALFFGSFIPWVPHSIREHAGGIQVVRAGLDPTGMSAESGGQTRTSSAC